MPFLNNLTENDLRLGLGFSKATKVLKKKSKSILPDPNPDVSIYIIQLIGSIIIPFIYLTGKYIANRLDKGDAWDALSKRAKLGLSIGITSAATIAKSFPKGMHAIVTIGISLVSGIMGAFLFATIPSMADPRKNKTEFTNTKLGIKLCSTILLGLTALICIDFSTAAIAICSVGGFLCGAICGGKYFPIIANYFAAKGNDNFSDRVQQGFNWGSTLGAAIGAVIGTCLLPGVGTALGGVIGAMFGTVITTIATTYSQPIYNFLKSKEALLGAKAGGIIGAAIGGVLGSIIAPGIGTAAGITIGSMIGIIAGGLVVKAADKIKQLYTNSMQNQQTSASQEAAEKNANERKHLLSQLKVGIGAGALFGGIIGTIVGGPLGAVVGAAIGTCVGIAAVTTYQIVRHIRLCYKQEKMTENNLIELENVNVKKQNDFTFDNANKKLQHLDLANNVPKLTENKILDTPTVSTNKFANFSPSKHKINFWSENKKLQPLTTAAAGAAEINLSAANNKYLSSR